MKRFICRFVSVLLSSAIITCAVPFFASRSFAKDNTYVKVGYFEYPGYHELNNDEYSGYGYDFLSLLKRYTNLNYELVGYEKSWEEMQKMLEEGEIDFITSARKTPEREKLFDFSEPIGTNSAQINVRIDDIRFVPGNYKALEGITIGELKGNSRNIDTDNFAKEKGFTYKVKEYNSAPELEKALKNKEVDAISSSSLRKCSNEKTIAEFAPEDFYCIVKKGNTELLNEINYGISQMDINEGNWRADLYYKNYESDSNSSLAFTERELEYIDAVKRGEKTITVTAQPDGNPYSFVENGELVGIIPDYFGHLMDMAGLSYEVCIPNNRDEFKEWLLSNKTNAVMDFRFGSSAGNIEDFGMVTDPYFKLTTSRVTRKGFNGKIDSIAFVDSWSNVNDFENVSDNAVYIQYSSREDALKAVSKGYADACYVYTYMAEKYINTDPDNKLQSSIMQDPVYEECIYISPYTDHELCSILNKCIKADTTGSLDEYINKYTNVTYDNLSTFQYLKMHPILIVAGSVIFALAIAIFVIIAVRAKSIKSKNELLNERIERLDQIKGLASQFALLYFVNLNTLDTTNYYLSECETPEEAKKIDDNSDNFFEAFKKSMVLYSHPDFREELLKYSDPKYVKEVLKDKRRHEFRFLCMNASGEYTWTDMILMKFSEKEDDEAVKIAVGYYNTDEEEKERQETARKQERNLEAIKGLADEYDTLQFVNLDADRYSTYYMVDYSPEKAKELSEESIPFTEFFKKSMETFCHPDYQDELLRFSNIDAIREQLIKQSKYSCRFLCDSDKGYRWCEFALIRLDKDSVPRRVAVCYTDIDDAVRVEENRKKALTDALAEAEVANKAKTDFLFNMSHDIRTPMNAIIGFTNIAMKNLDDKEKLTESLEKTKQSSNLLLSLINSILDMSRIESGKAVVDETPGDVRFSFANIETTTKELAQAKDIKLTFEFGELKDYYVYADYDRCTRIFINIITNAIKYTQEGGYVKVKCEQTETRDDGYGVYKYTFEDNGIGMSEEFVEHVFDRFSREENSTTRGIQGTGLGLSVVKSFVELMKGSVECKSQKNVGTTFTVILPLRIQAVDENHEYFNPETGLPVMFDSETVNEVQIDFTGMKVLLVEDNDFNREIASDILVEAGFVVETAEDGSVAVQIMKDKGESYYDFILMDIQMPIMGGYEATENIRKLYPDMKIPIIALSANAFAEDRETSIAAGMNDHVAKPINIKTLFRVLAKYKH